MSASKNNSQLLSDEIKECAWCKLPFHPWRYNPGICCSRACAGLLRQSAPLADRFWAKVDIKGPDECWLWTGAANQDGYGTAWVNGKLKASHRISWLLSKGPIPTGMDVLHKCDVRLCCNPNHFFSGTHGDNCRDRTRKGRTAKGEAHGRSKLTEAQVIEIRARFAAGESASKISATYGVTKSTVRHIKQGRHWKHLSTAPVSASAGNVQ